MKKRSILFGFVCMLALLAGGAMFISCDNGNGGDPSTPPAPAVVDAAWTFNGGQATIDALPTATYTGSVALTSDISIACDAGGSGATFKLLANSDNKPKYNTGIQMNTGTKTWDFAEITVDAACTIVLTAKPAGAYDAAKVRSVTLGDQTWSMSATDTSSSDASVTYAAPAAGSYIITAGGMKFTALNCSNQVQ